MHIDPDLAGHLAVAVRRHADVLDHLGRAHPPQLAELQDMLVAIAQGGPEQPGTVTAIRGGNVGSVDCDWLTPDEAAVAAGLSPRTIGRRIADGSLPSSKIGRSRRVSRTDLEEFMRERTPA